MSGLSHNIGSCGPLEAELWVGVAIRVNESCSCCVNVRIVSTFVNPNPT